MTEHDTNGYSTDRKMIEYRLDQTDAKLGHVEAAITDLAVGMRELQTKVTEHAATAGRWSGLISGGIVSVVVGVVIWLLTKH